MKYCLDDTIVAIASASGGAARGVIRLSGPEVATVLRKCFEASDNLTLQNIRRPTVFDGGMQLPGAGRSLPCALYVWPTTRSYTRQPAAELHTLGSPPLLSLALKAVCSAGARLAEPGEFTLRAFLAGRVDLTQAEAILGVIDAQNQRQLDVSLAQMAGGIGQPMRSLRSSLIDLLADLEAGLDFVEEDIHFIGPEQIDAALAQAANTINELLAQIQDRTTGPEVPRVVLLGPPNAGKSSLFNALVQSEHAIVSNVPGTTRDYLVGRLKFNGVECELVDTAGMEQATPDSINAAAQQQRSQQSDRAELRLICVDASKRRSENDCRRPHTLEYNELLVGTKCDLADASMDLPAIRTSSVTGAGLAALATAVAQHLQQLGSSESSVVRATAQRCRESLRSSLGAIENARMMNAHRSGDELLAAEIRIALDELGRVVGAVYTDDLLDRIFSRFCIGK